MPSSNSTLVRTPRGASKVVRANQIFSETTGMSRKIVVARLARELELTEAGASTYYQNCRKAAGLTGTRGTAALA